MLAVGSGRGEAFKAGSLYGVHSRQGVSPLDRLIAKGLEGCLGYRYYGGGLDRWLEIAEGRVDEALRLLAAASWIENSSGERITIHPERPVTLTLRYERQADGGRLSPILEGADGEDGTERLIVGAHAPWVWTPEGLFPLLGSAEAMRAAQTPIVIPGEDRAEFERRYLPDMAIAGRVTGPDLPTRSRVKKGKPTPQLVLEERNGALVGRLGYLYGGIRVEADEPIAHVGPPEGPWYSRSEAAEARWRERMPAMRGSTFTWKGDDAFDFLFEGLPLLIEAGVEVLGEDRLANLAVHRGKATTSFSVSSGIDWLDVEGAVHVGDEAVPWPALWEA
ncbi:MAG: SNF2 helicase associated domain-containing protein, partial [Candidatus Sericytochromatia bacterium]